LKEAHSIVCFFYACVFNVRKLNISMTITNNYLLVKMGFKKSKLVLRVNSRNTFTEAEIAQKETYTRLKKLVANMKKYDSK
jgi:hypothetical protein